MKSLNSPSCSTRCGASLRSTFAGLLVVLTLGTKFVGKRGNGPH